MFILLLVRSKVLLFGQCASFCGLSNFFFPFEITKGAIIFSIIDIDMQIIEFLLFRGQQYVLHHAKCSIDWDIAMYNVQPFFLLRLDFFDD